MYSLVDEFIGCKDCHYFVPNCLKCLNSTACSKCHIGYVLDVTSKSCKECPPNCEVCNACDCTDDIMYNFVSKDVGCKDCALKVPNCLNCTNKAECN